MSTTDEPNEPKVAGEPNGTSGPPKGPQGSSGSGGEQDTAASAAANSSANGARPSVSVQDQGPRPDAGQGQAPAQGRPPGNGTGPGGVPPWQRAGAQGGQGQPTGPGQPSASATGPQPQIKQPPQQPPQQGSGRGPAGPPPGRQPGQGAPAPTTKRPVITGTAAPKLPGSETDANSRSPLSKPIDGPTRNIDRRDLPQEDLPDLDAIHHPEASQPANRSFEAMPSPSAMGALRAAVQIRRIDPWSAFKVSAVLSVASFFIWMIAVGVLYLILDGMGVWDQLNNSFGTLVSSDTTAESSFEISAGGVFGIAALIGAVNVVLFTALATVGSFIYNLSSDLVGGVEVTLADRD